MKSFAAALLFLLSSSVNGQVVIRGTVTDGNGSMPILAQAHVGAYNGNAKKSENYTCSRDGAFEFTLPKSGLYSLRFSAVNHEEVTIPLILRPSDKAITLNVQLKPNPFNESFDRITIIGDWNKFEFSGADTMTPSTNSNGKTIYTYHREAAGDTLAYQLLGVAGSHSVNGTQADYYAYDGGGDYRSVLKTKKGENVTITFDPSKWDFAPNADLPEVTVTNDPFLQKAIALSMTADAMYNDARVFPLHGGPVTISGSKYREMVAYVKGKMEEARSEGDSLLAQFAGVTLAGEYSPSSPFGNDVAVEILHTVPPSSTFWAMEPMYANSMLAMADSEFAVKYRKGLESNTDRIVRAYGLAGEMQSAYDRKDDAAGNMLYASLKNDYGDVNQIKYLLESYDPDSPTKIGKHVPEFTVTSLDGSETISDKSMLGKYYMIDFWATWCGPCVGEMPSLHKAYEKFKGRKGFEILSLSMDGDVKQITPFRKKWAMPWLNAFLPGVWDADLAKEFEVSFIPDPILVGPDGTILARQESLRGEELEKTLTKYLGESD